MPMIPIYTELATIHLLTIPKVYSLFYILYYYMVPIKLIKLVIFCSQL